ncbi:MAG: YtpI family protein [Solibacillus sp.]
MLNLVLVACIIILFAVFFYYKTKQFRTTLPIRKKWYKAKAGVVFGIFLMTFGINAVVRYEGTAVSIIVMLLFLLYGALQVFSQYKRVQHEGRFIKEEYTLNQ